MGDLGRSSARAGEHEIGHRCGALTPDANHRSILMVQTARLFHLYVYFSLFCPFVNFVYLPLLWKPTFLDYGMLRKCLNGQISFLNPRGSSILFSCCVLYFRANYFRFSYVQMNPLTSKPAEATTPPPNTPPPPRWQMAAMFCGAHVLRCPCFAVPMYVCITPANYLRNVGYNP